GMAVTFLACEKTPCDASYTGVYLEVAGGPGSISSYQLSGACRGGGTGMDCQLSVCSSSTPCSCYIHVPINNESPGSTSSVCHIEVVSVTGSVFVVDVGTVDLGGECINWSLADPAQSTINVQFAGGDTDGGTTDTSSD